MEDTDKSPVAKRRRIDEELHGNTPLVSHYISDNIVTNEVKEETLDFSEISISKCEKDDNGKTDPKHDDDDDNGNNDEIVDSDDGSFDYYGNPHDDNAIASCKSLFGHNEMSVDQISDGNDNEEIDDKRKLLIATEKLACLDGKYFEVVIDKSSLTGTIVAKCKLCDPQKWFKGSLRSTSNFTTHLKRCHKNNYEEYTKYSEEKRKGSDANKKIDRKRWSTTCVFNQEQFEANVANFILRFMVPFRAVEDPVFRKLFDDLKIKKNDCQLQHLTRYSLMKRVDGIFKKSLDDIRKEIVVIINQGGYVCTTADVWTGGSRRFLGVTVSWIHPESLERKSAAIACKRFDGTHSFDAIADQLSSIHTSFGLTSQSIRATVTDNGSSFVKAFKEFGVEALNSFTDSNEEQFQDLDKTIDIGAYETDFDAIDEDIEISSEFSRQCENKLARHVRCASHTLNLIATTDSLKAINNSKPLKKKYFYVIRKCSEVWKSLRSPETSENLKEYLGISLKRPVVIRWNSTYDCINQLLSVENKLLDNSKMKLTKAFKSKDLKFLAEYIRVSKPLACAIDRLQADKSYYGVLLPTLVSLRYEMKQLIDDNALIDFKPLAQAIIDGINKRFQNLFDPSRPNIDAFLAAISHPQFKGRWLTPFTEKEQKKIHERFSDVVFAEASLESTTNHNEIDEFNFGETSSSIPEFQPSLSKGETAAEVARYLKSRETGLSLLEKFPSIRKVFLKFNTPLPSSAPTERLFSHVTMMNLPRYNRLSDDHFEQRVLCKVNAAKTYH